MNADSSENLPAPVPASENLQAPQGLPKDLNSNQQMGGKKSKTAKVKGGKYRKYKKSRKMNKSAKSWVSFVTEIFNKKRSVNPNYKYKQAMKDASKLMKKNKSMKM